MFRLFIREKLDSKKKKVKNNGAEDAKRHKRNRRVYERYQINHKHLTMMNEQDILLIRELSAKGFSTFVSQRGWERFTVGDVFSARMRYLGEMYDLEAKVSWKSKKDVVGFELIKTDARTIEFMHRLIYPNEIAMSLRLVDAKFMAESSERKSWYHGDKETDLYIWHDQDGGINAWRLVTKDRYIEWVANKGLMSGNVKIANESVGGVFELQSQETERMHDPELDEGSRQLAIDVFMAVAIPEKGLILETLTG